MKTSSEQRKTARVQFSQGLDVRLVAIDGTWTRACSLKDVSEDGAQLVVTGTVEGLGLREFFLVLSTTGTAYRRCELAWVNGDLLGVSFLKSTKKKKASVIADNV